ncbi:acyl transferase/acyl hydrolase/lysophospholipase [Scenedesmus sp. NREL 46B-D3]|nr:acyl transferase/acyl hydrolase/lysophospholipase [Scenedesmus sp. NREL 46B-D3]
MAPARAALQEVLDSVEVRAPRVPVLSNVTADPFPPEPAAIRELLGRQLVEPVRWQATLTGLLSQQGPDQAWAGCSRLYELGPGQQIKAMVRRVDQAAWRAFKNVPAE